MDSTNQAHLKLHGTRSSQKKKKTQCLCVHLQVPNAAGVEESGVHLDSSVHFSHIPNIHTVVIIHTAEPAADRIVANSDGIRVAGVLVGRKQVADGREKLLIKIDIALKRRNVGREYCLRLLKPEFLTYLGKKIRVELNSGQRDKKKMFSQ